MHRITLQPAGDLDDLGRRWRALESHADGGFFRGWTFLGCLAKTRFARAQLLAVRQDGVDVGLALLGRAAGRTFLNETGIPALDSVFIEHNGLLLASEAAPALPAALRAARGRGRLLLSAIDDATLAAARHAGWVDLRQSRLAPCVALDTLSTPYLDTLSANARAQIRRSMRLFGPELRLACAQTASQAHAFFDEMVALHQSTWRKRGEPGAFATSQMRDFHCALIARAWPAGEADLLRIAAGPRHVGTLYNFMQNGRIASYQSGFVPADDSRHKPGLVCHALAIAHYAATGARSYDLLAGADRYKLTLASGGETLHWATLHPSWSVSRVVAGARRWAAESKQFFFEKKNQKTFIN